MDIPSKQEGTPSEPVKKAPEGENQTDITAAIGWQIPTCISKDLFDAEFKDPQSVVSMFNALGAKIEALSAVEEPDTATITFQFWRVPKTGAKKRKPLQLDATIYQHPDYDSFWIYLEYAS